MNDLNIRSDLDESGILTAYIDMPGRSMNVFSVGMMDSLEALIGYVERTAGVRAVVLSSAKTAFLAGADLAMIRVFTERARTDTSEQLHRLCGHLSRLLRRIETSRKPWIAALNGLALGGGLELALACHQRVVVDDAAIQLGLPEITLGLLPGAGGTQRLPRLIGMASAMRMLLLGTPVTPQQALALGLVDELASPDDLIPATRRRAANRAVPLALWDIPGQTFSSAPFDFLDPKVYAAIIQAVGIEPQRMEKTPAYQAILNCVVKGWNLTMDAAISWEMDCFVDLIRDPVAGNRVSGWLASKASAKARRAG